MNRATRTVLVRVAWVVPVALGVVTVTFFVSRVLSGDPSELFMPSDADQQLRDQIRASMGLDASLPVQYWTFLVDLLHGDLGTSFTTGQPVAADLSDRLPATLELGLVGVLIGLGVGIPLGVLAAIRRDGWPDFLIRGVTVGGMALPSFWLGLILILLFSVTLDVLPGPVGRLPIGTPEPDRVTGFLLVDSLLAGDPGLFGQACLHLVLPAVTLGVLILAPVARVTRTAMVEALQSDYVRTAVAMGTGKARVWFRCALRNALLPVVTMSGGVIGFAFSGAVLIEAVFGWPGVGQYALSAISRADYPALQGFVMYAALLYVLVYLAVDLLYLVVDPRTRT